MSTFTERIKKAWNAFARDPTDSTKNREPSYSYRPDRNRLRIYHERSIISSIYNRIAIDAAQCEIRHVRIDENDRYIANIDSKLNQCFTVEANLDQTGRAFVQDAVMSMCDEGCIALVPVETSRSPIDNEAFDILNIRVAKIVQWYPSSVCVRVYNEQTGQKEDIIMSKRSVAIIENPLYAVMNEPNSTLQRLLRKLALLDAVDDANGAGKLDLIIQLPYVIKSEARKTQAEARRKDIEMQLSDSKYGIAYTDGTERVIQLNRQLDNNLLNEIQYLTTTLYNQLGLTEDIFNGKADEKTILNYYNRTIEPILSSITEEVERKFLTRTARSQKQAIRFFRDPFKLVPVNDIAEIADKFTRNEILSSNELRALVGFKPVDDERANELRNKNLKQSNEELAGQYSPISTDGYSNEADEVYDQY